jgi:beta-glucanase (GH16 family)
VNPLIWLLVGTVTITVLGWLGIFLASRRDDFPPPVRPIWADEFPGPSGAPPDPTKWGRDRGGHGWGNQELEFYTDSTENAALDGAGNLVITASSDDARRHTCWYGPCRYTSARLLTLGNFSQRYGRIEARIRVPSGQGVWPAFWALGDNISSVGWPASGEIDIMENIGSEPATIHGSLHGPGSAEGNPFTGSYRLSNGKAFSDDFHVFALDWTPEAITWYMDGTRYSRHTRSELTASRWVFDRPFFLILNLAVGGTWPGSPDGSSRFPQRMTVDYVRCYAVTGLPR